MSQCLTHLVYFLASLCSCFSVSWVTNSSPFSELSASEAREGDLPARSIDPSDGNYNIIQRINIEYNVHGIIKYKFII